MTSGLTAANVRRGGQDGPKDLQGSSAAEVVVITSLYASVTQKVTGKPGADRDYGQLRPLVKPHGYPPELTHERDR